MSARILTPYGLSAALLLAGTFAAAATEPPPGPTPPASCTCPVAALHRHRQIERRLAMPVTLNFKDAPLRQVIEDIRTHYNLNVYIDEVALAEQSIALNSPVSVTFDQISLRSALKLLLREVHLTYVIRDEVLVVTTPSHSKGAQQRNSYQVGDLVIPVNDSGDPDPAGAAPVEGSRCGRSPCGGGTADNVCITKQPVKTTEESLIRLITSTVEPGSWSDMGGPGTIQYFPLTMSLVINQTPDVQEQVADLLAALRRRQDQEVAVEVRFATVPEDFLERAGADFNIPGRVPGVTFLNDTQVVRFMEAIQGDRRTNVMQAPKVTAFNGQAANLDITDQQFFVTGIGLVERQGKLACVPMTETFPIGVRLSVRPVISADRRSVNVTVSANLTNLDSSEVPLVPVEMSVRTREKDGLPGQPIVFRETIQQPKFATLALERTLMIPDGHTAVLSGLEHDEVRDEYGPPVLSKIPYINRVFNNVGHGRTREHTLVLVTPRIVVTEEEKVRQTDCVAPPAAKEDPVKHKAAELMKQFNTFYKEGKYHEAEVCAAAAHVLAPEDPVAVAAIEVARKQGSTAASAERAPASDRPRARKAHRRPREMPEVAPR
jgi:general secretion pathway protein D